MQSRMMWLHNRQSQPSGLRLTCMQDLGLLFAVCREVFNECTLHSLFVDNLMFHLLAFQLDALELRMTI